VTDTGMGIAPEHMAHLFEPFFTTKPSGEGTGLGLFICKSIVEGFDGSISVESRPGKGSTFRLSLPPHVRDSRTASTPAQLTAVAS
jgi:signal transduction histidine kinase